MFEFTKRFNGGGGGFEWWGTCGIGGWADFPVGNWDDNKLEWSLVWAAWGVMATLWAIWLTCWDCCNFFNSTKVISSVRRFSFKTLISFSLSHNSSGGGDSYKLL